MNNKPKILEIGSYPPPNSGWSVRIKYIKKAFEKKGYDCKVLNRGKNRNIKSDKYIDVQSEFDYLKKIILYRLKGYQFHEHMNGQAVKGPILTLGSILLSMLTLKRPALTFHGGINQLYFPKDNGKRMYWIIYLNFLLSKIIICNNEAIKKEILRYGPFIRADKIYPIPAFSIQYMDYTETELPVEVEKFIQKKKNIIVCYIVLRNGFFIETLIDFLNLISSDIGVILCGVRKVEDPEVEEYSKQLKKLEANNVILSVENLDHDQFLTLLSKSHIYLRTPVSDGIASSVLEALSLNIPVVASENGRRPKSVITYDANDANSLTVKIKDVSEKLAEYKNNIVKPIIRDTVNDEVVNLLKCFE